MDDLTKSAATQLAMLAAMRERACELRRASTAIFESEHQRLLDLNGRLSDAVVDGRIELCGAAWRRYVDAFITPQVAREQRAHIEYDRARRAAAEAGAAHDAALKRAGLGTPTEYIKQQRSMQSARPMSPPYRPLTHSYADERRSVEKRQQQLAEREQREAAIDATFKGML